MLIKIVGIINLLKFDRILGLGEDRAGGNEGVHCCCFGVLRVLHEEGDLIQVEIRSDLISSYHLKSD